MSVPTTEVRAADAAALPEQGIADQIPPRSPRPSGQVWKRALALAATIAAGLVVVFIIGPRVLGAATPHFYAGTVLQQSTAAPSLDELQFGDGSPVDLAAFEGDVVMLYFGYTGCPDVCPTTLSVASQAVDELSASEAEHVRLIMVSVDPERDDAPLVQEYAQFFHESFLGASGETADILEAATQYGIFYAINEPDDPTEPHDYFVDHTSTLMAIDTGGALRVVWAPDAVSGEISGDLQELLRQ